MTYEDNFITSPDSKPCETCGKETDQIEINFETYLHQGECASAMWVSYMIALTHIAILEEQGVF